MSNNKQQTAVEWFIKELEQKGFPWVDTEGVNRIHFTIDTWDYLDIKKESNKMHKERMIDFALLCMFGTVDVDIDVVKEFVKKYNETYRGGEQC